MLKQIALSLLCTLFLGLLTACNPSGALRSKDSESPLQKEASKGAENTPETSQNPAENTKNSAPEVGVRDGISAPVAIPPSFDGQQRPLEPGQNGTAYMPNGLPALQPMKGINADELFSENIRDSDERFNRLENAVVDIRKEFDSMKPSIIRLAAVESDIQNLIKELEVMLQETPSQQPQQQPVDLMAGGADASLDEAGEQANLQIHQLEPQPPPPPAELSVPQVLTPQAQPEQAATPQATGTETNTNVPVPGAASSASPPPQNLDLSLPQPAPESAANAVPPKAAKPVSTPVYETPKPAAAQTPAAAPAKQHDGTVATNLRLGEHGNKVRVVLDTNATLAFTIDYDEGENLIVVEIPDAKWVGEKQKSFADSALIDSYSVTESNGGKGSTIAITLKKSSKILKQDSLEPDDNPNHRIYFDLAL